MRGKFVGAVLVVATLVVACGCGSNKPLLNPKDPFDDPFFHDGLGSGTSSLDEIMREPAPSVGWLSRDGARPPHGNAEDDDADGSSDATGATGSPGAKAKLNADGEGVLLEAEGDDSYVGRPHHHHQVTTDDDAGSEEGTGGPEEKSFSDKAEEASLATMSILMGLGMAALPFLIGT